MWRVVKNHRVKMKDELKLVIQSLNNSKSSGIDEIPMCSLRKGIATLLEPIHHIINDS